MKLLRSDGLYVEDISIDSVARNDDAVIKTLSADNRYKNIIGFVNSANKLQFIKKPFTLRSDGSKVLSNIQNKTELYTNKDQIQSYDFYLKGFFGYNPKGEPYVRIVPLNFKTSDSNVFRFYKEGSNIKLLCTESPANVSLEDIARECSILGKHSRFGC
jgi:hypothetical protein